jgi:hypothetical protein
MRSRSLWLRIDGAQSMRERTLGANGVRGTTLTRLNEWPACSGLDANWHVREVMGNRVLTILLTLLLASPLAAQIARAPQVVRVAIVADGPSETGPSLRALFLEEIRAVNRGEFDIQAPAGLQLDADRSLAGVHQAIDRVLADPRTDLVVALGVLASQVAAQRAALPRPVVAAFVTNRGLQHLPYKDGASGKTNLSYVSLDVDIRRDLMAFREIVPFERLAFLIDGTMMEAIPGIRAEVARVARELDVEATQVAVADDAAAALAAIAPDAQAAYVGPLLRMRSDAYQ